MHMKKMLKQLTPPLIYTIYRKIFLKNNFYDKDRFYTINNRNIFLPAGHKLDLYQSIYKRYDKFLPHCASFINDGFIIDIGANVGDSVYGMLNTSSTHFICIEPEPNFYSLLKNNIESLEESIKKRIKIFNIAISSTEISIDLKIENGTAHRISSIKSTIPATSLDSFIRDNFEHLSPEDCRLIKIDTDGFDYDCILSGGNFFSKTSAYVFWETLFSDEYALNNYTRACQFLIKNGYIKFYIFDNFGNFITPIQGKDIIYFLQYYDEIRHYESAIPYYDIFACKEKCIAQADNIISTYTIAYK